MTSWTYINQSDCSSDFALFIFWRSHSPLGFLFSSQAFTCHGLVLRCCIAALTVVKDRNANTASSTVYRCTSELQRETTARFKACQRRVKGKWIQQTRKMIVMTHPGISTKYYMTLPTTHDNTCLLCYVASIWLTSLGLLLSAFS